jgi:hypothetical protein
MAGAISFISYKVFRDSTSKLYAIFEGYSGDPIVTAVENSGYYSASKSEVSTTVSGGQQYLTAYDKIPDSISQLTFNITLESGKVESVTAKVPNSKQALLETYGALTQSVTTVLSGTNNTIAISDALYYSKSKYKQLYIFPSSSTNYLDTSTVKDYYYVSDGGAAYVGSNELQNAFLNEIKYTVKGYNSEQLGKFKGGDNGKSIQYECYTEVAKKGPAVFGGAMILKSSVMDENEVYVCVDPSANNYYLTGCVDETWPCVPSSTLADACNGNTLTVDVINNWVIQNGDCCTSCAGYGVTLTLHEATDGYTADGSMDITVIGGSPSYAYVNTAISLDNVETSTYSQVSGSSSTATFSIGSLYAGQYELSVTDDDGCNSRHRIYIGSEVEGTGEGWGCGPSGSSSAINYDAGIATAYETDSLCVYCNATSGLLEHGTDGDFVSNTLGTWADMGLTVTPATTNPVTGAAIANGTVVFSNLTQNNYLLTGPNEAEYNLFNSAEWFSGSATASPYQYLLYKISQELDYGSQSSGDNVKTNISGDAGSSLVSTTNNADPGGFNLGSLVYGRYVMILGYTDSTGGTQEYEECYSIKEFTIGLMGCNNPDAPNYNSAVTIPDSSLCLSNECTPEAFNTPLFLDVGGYGIDCMVSLWEDDWLANNPGVYDAFNNGYEDLGIALQGLSSSLQNTPQGQAQLYILENIFCGVLPISGDSNNSWVNTSTYTNGLAIAEDAIPTLGLNLFIPVFTVTFADGTTNVVTIENNSPENVSINAHALFLSNLLYYSLNDNQTTITHWPCEYILEHGGITSVTTQINYGEPGVWGQVYTSTWLNAGDNYVDLVSECQLAECEDPSQDVYGCTDPAATNYNPEATVSDGSCLYPEPDDIPGCTDPEASNYNEAANLDDGSCEYITLDIPGCTDPEANNYDPDATIDNGSCLYPDNQNDCSTLLEFAGTNSAYIEANAVASNTSSSLDSDSGLCVSDATGQIQIPFPDTSGLTINNPNGLYLGSLLMWITAPTELYPSGSATSASWDTSWQDTDSFNAIYSGTYGFQVSDLINPAEVSSYTYTGLDNGIYVLFLLYTPYVVDDGSGNLVVAAPAGNGLDIFNCSTNFAGMITVGIDACPENDDVFGCTDPSADNYNPEATVDDLSCLYSCNGGCEGECLCPDGSYSVDCCTSDPIPGCTDPNASNYNASATMEDGSCTYPSCFATCVDFTSAACIPNYMNHHLHGVEECIANAGESFYTKLITGLSDDCSTMEAWKMIIISELLGQKGLPCVYNCADSTTPDTIGLSCAETWENQGSLYWNPAQTAAYQVGTIVKHNDIFYQASSSTGLNLDPSTPVSFPENIISGWQPCVNAVTFSDNTNYLEKFLSFAQSYCKDCGIPPYLTGKDRGTQIINDLTIGGLPIENDGTSYGTSDNE